MHRAIALLLCAGCVHDTPPAPRTHVGWGVAVMVVGGAWVVSGPLVVAEGGGSVGARIGEGAAAVGIGALLLYAGYKLAE